VSAAAFAFAQVFLAVWSAPQELVNWSQMNWVMMSMFWAEPWLKEVLSTGSKEVSLRLSKPTPNSIWGTLQEPKLPMPELLAAAVEAEAAAPAVLAAAVLAAAVLTAAVLAAAPLLEPVPAMGLPWSSMAWTAAKFWIKGQGLTRTLEWRETYGLDVEHCVEEIGLYTGLGSTSVSSSLSLRTSVLSRLVSAARVGQLVTDEFGNDVDVLSRAVVEGSLVDGLERGLLAVVEADTEFNLRDTARAEVTNAGAACSSRRGWSSSNGSSGNGSSGIGSVGGGGGVSTTAWASASNGITLIIDSLDSGEVLKRWLAFGKDLQMTPLTVLMLKAALKRSACTPVLAAPVSAAAWAFAQVSLAVWSAPQELVSVSQINWVMMSMFCAEPWLKEVLSTGSKEVSLRLSKPTPNSIWGTEQLPIARCEDARNRLWKENIPKLPMLASEAESPALTVTAAVEAEAVPDTVKVTASWKTVNTRMTSHGISPTGQSARRTGRATEVEEVERTDKVRSASWDFANILFCSKKNLLKGFVGRKWMLDSNESLEKPRERTPGQRVWMKEQAVKDRQHEVQVMEAQVTISEDPMGLLFEKT
jgi:uncharacterized membrane protein YgcG